MMFTFGDYHKLLFFSDHRAVNKIFDCSLSFNCKGENEIEELPAFPTSTDTMSVASGSESGGSSSASFQVPKLKLEGQSSSRQSQAQSLSKSSNQLESFKFPVSRRIL